MNTERDTTRLLEAWLAEPEPPLDDHVIDTAIDGLSDTPQRRRWWPFRWFPLGIGATRSAGPAGPHGEERNRSMFTATRVAAGVAVLALAGSLAMIAGPLQSPPEPAVPAALSPSPAPADGIHVSGRIDFLVMSDPPPDFGETVQESDGSTSYRDARFETRWTANDARFVGAGEYTGNSNSYALDESKGIRVGWGTHTIDTDVGTWTSRRPGALGIGTETESVYPVWFEGSGDYEGLSAFLLQEIQAIEGSNHTYMTFEGWVVPGDRHFEDVLE